jgi:YHS domain-containing protein
MMHVFTGLLAAAVTAWSYGSSIAADEGKAAQPQPAPHGGQVTASHSLNFEVVYLPLEIRVYVYGVMPTPASAKGVSGNVVLQPPHDPHSLRLALKYVAQAAGQQDYLSAAVDMRHVKPGDLTAAFTLADLPQQDRAGATFTQAVVVSQPKPRVVLAAADPADQAIIARQRVCPVSGAALGSMGAPIKVLVDGKPVYLCCRGCLGRIQANPDQYVKKESQSQ